MNKHTSFEIGDLIAVFGGEISKEGSTADSVTVCKVLVVGELDLLVEEASGRFSRLSTCLVPKTLSVKLEISPSHLESETILTPQLGDLVLAYSRDSFKNETPTKTTGILFKITYKLGKPYVCTIISGDEMKEVPADNLIVLQRKA
jgi:hypothetical protein